MKKVLIGLIATACVLLGYLAYEKIENPSKTYHYYSTVADERHFGMLMSLISSIHKVDYDKLDQIAVFDVGLNEQQRKIIGNIEKVKIYDVEMTNPDLLTYFQTSPEGRTVRGWFAWKPVVFKQSLDMFPYFLYLDSGSQVLNDPDNLFKHIKQNGYFLIQITPHPIKERITKTAIEKVIASLPEERRDEIMDSDMIDAGFQGLSRDVYADYVLPMYKLSSDLSVFADDGSSQMGFGAGRHDQTLYSIYVNKEGYTTNNQGWSVLTVDGQKVPFHMHWNRPEVNNQTTIYRSRSDINYGGNNATFIKWKALQPAG